MEYGCLTATFNNILATKCIVELYGEHIFSPVINRLYYI